MRRRFGPRDGTERRSEGGWPPRPDRPRGAGLSHLVGDVAVRHDAAIWNLHQSLEDAPLEIGGSGEVEPKIEVPSLPVEIFTELVEGGAERAVSVGIPVTLLDHLGRYAPDPANPIAGDPDRDGSGGRVAQDTRVDRRGAFVPRHQRVVSPWDLSL